MKTKLKPLNLPKEYAIQKHILPPISGGIPIRPYPRWLRLILESKLPTGLIPKDEYIMTTRKLSQSLYRSHPQQEFDLSDPYMRYRPFTVYNPLSDPHCAKYFSRPDIHNNLHRRGFITEDDKVIVGLPEFNQYRKYLYRLQLNEIKEYRRREFENILFERAIRERRRVDEFWKSEEYEAIQNRRSRCVDLCRVIREIDEEERKRYLRFYTADVERKAEWKLEKLKNSAENSRLIGIECQLLDMKEIKEGIARRKQLLLKEWMKKIHECEERKEDLEIFAEIERRKKARYRARRMRDFQKKVIPEEDEAREVEDEERREAAEQRKILVNIRRREAYQNFMQLRNAKGWRDIPIEKTNFDKSTFKAYKESKGKKGLTLASSRPPTKKMRPSKYKPTLEMAEIKTEPPRRLSFDESKIVLDSENTIDEEIENAEEEFYRMKSGIQVSTESAEETGQDTTSVIDSSSSGIVTQFPKQLEPIPATVAKEEVSTEDGSSEERATTDESIPQAETSQELWTSAEDFMPSEEMVPPDFIIPPEEELLTTLEVETPSKQEKPVDEEMPAEKVMTVELTPTEQITPKEIPTEEEMIPIEEVTLTEETLPREEITFAEETMTKEVELTKESVSVEDVPLTEEAQPIEVSSVDKEMAEEGITSIEEGKEDISSIDKVVQESSLKEEELSTEHIISTDEEIPKIPSTKEAILEEVIMPTEEMTQDFPSAEETILAEVITPIEEMTQGVSSAEESLPTEVIISREETMPIEYYIPKEDVTLIEKIEPTEEMMTVQESEQPTESEPPERVENAPTEITPAEDKTTIDMTLEDAVSIEAIEQTSPEENLSTQELTSTEEIILVEDLTSTENLLTEDHTSTERISTAEELESTNELQIPETSQNDLEQSRSVMNEKPPKNDE